MVSQKRKQWIWEEQRKHHRCHCGCGQYLIISDNDYYKGLHKFISGRRGKKHTKLQKEKWSDGRRKGKNNSWFGKKHTKESSNKMIKNNKTLSGENNHNYKKRKIVYCSNCGKKLERLKIKNNNFCNYKCRGKWEHNYKTKENSQNWLGGRINYCPKYDEPCKESNRKKFNNQCFLCGKLEKNNIIKNLDQIKLDTHHVDYNKMQGCDTTEWKLVPLCRSCHMKTNNKYMRNYYEYLLSNMLYFREMILKYENKIDYRSL